MVFVLALFICISPGYHNDFDQGSVNLYNVISPNNDGHNDVLAFDQDPSQVTLEILVVDQWGQKVYESNNYQNDWGGTDSSGRPLAAGIYKYYLKIGNDKYQSPLNIIYN